MQKKMTNVIKFCLPANIPHVTMTKSIFYKIFMVQFAIYILETADYL